METFNCRSTHKNSPLGINKEGYNHTDSMVESKLQQRKLCREKTYLNKTGEVKPDIKVISNIGSQRELKFGSITFAKNAKTPKPPEVPRSTTFYCKSSDSRLQGDGEVCKQDDNEIDYCSIERLPGDGCFSEGTEEDDVGNLSDGFYEEDLFEGRIDGINEESCSEGIFACFADPRLKEIRVANLQTFLHCLVYMPVSESRILLINTIDYKQLPTKCNYLFFEISISPTFWFPD